MGPHPVRKMDASLQSVHADVTMENTERPKNATSAGFLWSLLFVFKAVLGSRREPAFVDMSLPTPKILCADLDGVRIARVILVVRDCHENASAKLENITKPRARRILPVVFIVEMEQVCTKEACWRCRRRLYFDVVFQNLTALEVHNAAHAFEMS